MSCKASIPLPLTSSTTSSKYLLRHYHSKHHHIRPTSAQWTSKAHPSYISQARSATKSTTSSSSIPHTLPHNPLTTSSRTSSPPAAKSPTKQHQSSTPSTHSQRTHLSSHQCHICILQPVHCTHRAYTPASDVGAYKSDLTATHALPRKM